MKVDNNNIIRGSMPSVTVKINSMSINLC